ncbi:ATP-binding protein [Streptomyces sp. L2]|uniref:ATP-binding protein n=1 Tax=Streptomyces sp. L2 TaxID=2162665 RepID=UPI001013B6E9|nr:ATP-binding protein [Streptomyces sp. L2]
MDIPLGARATVRPRPALLRQSLNWDYGPPCLAEARNAVRALLARAEPAPGRRAVQDAQLVVSELVTNAIRHAPGPGTLRLELAPDAATLRISVIDTSTDPPLPRPPDPGRVGGHGLRLVTLLSTGLRTTPVPGGKRVTATVALTDGPA